MKYFENCKNLEELKKEYKKLAFKHHPDRGGDVEIMKVVNNAYEYMFNMLSKKEGKKDSKQTTTKEEYKAEKFNDFIDIINKLIGINDIELEIIGTWLWVSGNTYKHKDILKGLGFLFSKKNKSWYMTDTRDTKKTWTRKTYSMDEKRQMHGSTKFKGNNRPQLT